MFLRFLQTALVILTPLVADAAVVTDSSASQYIIYEGSVSARVTWESCGQDVTLGPYENSRLYAGVNPPWDKNPFFFDLYHRSTEGGSVVFSFTEDSVYNLEFTSAGLSCFSDGKRCDSFESDYYFVPDTALDLTKAKVQTTTTSGEPGYTISGDSNAWISNGTLDVNSVDVEAACPGSWDWENTIWNNTMPFKWEMSITNTSASFSITTTTPGKNVGSMMISFSGKRTNSSMTAYPPQGVQLDTSDAQNPRFTFVDGKNISFVDTSGRWRAYNNPLGVTGSSSSTSPRSTSTQLPTSTTTTLTTTLTTSTRAAATSTAAASRVTLPDGSTNMAVTLGLGGFIVLGLDMVL